MDLDALASRYQGEARLQRLLYVSSHATQQPHALHPTVSNTELAQTALQLAHQYLQQAGNVVRYKEVFGNGSTAGNIMGMPSPDDVVSYCHHQDAENRQQKQVLLHRLAQAQAQCHKEALRQAFTALGDFDWQTGNLSDAIGSWLRAKDYCTTRTQSAVVSLKVLEAFLHVKNYGSVRDYVMKLSHTLASTTHTSAALSSGSITAEGAVSMTDVKGKVQIASALEALFAGNYRSAALRFVNVVTHGYGSTSTTTTTMTSTTTSTGAGTSSGEASGSAGGPTSPTSATTTTTAASTGSIVHWPTVLCAEETTLYAGFLALTCLSRDEMVSLAEHPEALELAPPLREALLQFGRRSNYQQAWQICQDHVFPLLELDVYMAPHLSVLQDMIRQKSLLQYWQAYRRVSLTTMAEELGSGLVPSADFLVSHMITVIGNGQAPDTRINLQANTLERMDGMTDTNESRDAARLQATQDKLTTVTSQVLDDTYSMVIRLSCIEHNLSVTDPTANAQRRNKRRGVRGRRPRGRGGGQAGGDTFDLRDDEGDEGAAPAVEDLVVNSSDDEEEGVEVDYIDSDAEMDAQMVDAGDDMNPEDMY